MRITEPRLCPPSPRCVRVVGRFAVVATLAFLVTASLQAQQVNSSTPENPSTSLFAANSPGGLDFVPATSFDISSSSTKTDDPVLEERLSLGGNIAQPPPRRRYGRPRYSDKLHNADGSNKIAFIAGGGFEIPADSTTRQYLTTSYKFQVGAGLNFNKKVAILLQFDYNNFGLPASLIANQQNVYSGAGFVQQGPNGTTVPADFTNLDGNTHIWSITLNPTYNFYQGDAFGFYAVVGGGFYHKVTNFTLPQTGVSFDPFFGPFQFTTNQTFDKYTSNSPGVNGGLGLTYKPSKFAGERLYAEIRYEHTFNSQRFATATNSNFFPGNSAPSSYIPVTFGVRF